jgi:hypothetical protein
MNSASSSLLVFAVLPAVVAALTLYLNRWTLVVRIHRRKKG